MTAEQAETLRRLAKDAYELDAFKPTSRAPRPICVSRCCPISSNRVTIRRQKTSSFAPRAPKGLASARLVLWLPHHGVALSDVTRRSADFLFWDIGPELIRLLMVTKALPPAAYFGLGGPSGVRSERRGMAGMLRTPLVVRM
jgi:hypothetical protein